MLGFARGIRGNSMQVFVSEAVVLPHHMGWLQPVPFTFVSSMLRLNTKENQFVTERTFMYGIWHIYNYGHWIHDNLFAMYATMMDHGGINRDNRIVALAVHQWDRPANEHDPYEANGPFMDLFQAFSRHKVLRIEAFSDTSKSDFSLECVL